MDLNKIRREIVANISKSICKHEIKKYDNERVLTCQSCGVKFPKVLSALNETSYGEMRYES